MPPRTARPAESPLFADNDEELIDELAGEYDNEEESEDEDEGTPPPVSDGEEGPEQTQGWINKRMEGELDAPRHKLLDAGKLYDMVKREEINLEPAYQRDVVWTKQKMIGLIQSMMLRYYVPPLIFAHNNLRKYNETLICIDGKQRCSSIVAFMDGEIPFISLNTREKLYYKATKKGQKLLPKPMRRAFETVQMALVEYDELGEEQQRDLFQRVQLGMALTPAEKLQAHSSAWATWIHQLVNSYIRSSDGYSKLLSADFSRAKGFQNVAGFLLLALDENKRAGAEVIPTFSAARRVVERTDVPDSVFKWKAEKSLGILLRLAEEYRAEAFETTTRKLAPVEFIFMLYMIYRRMSTFSLSLFASTFGKLRRDLHKTFPGQTMIKGSVLEWLRAFDAALPKPRALAEKSAEEEVYPDDEGLEEEEVAPEAVTGERNKRKQDEGDGEYKAAPEAKRGPKKNGVPPRGPASRGGMVPGAKPSQRMTQNSLASGL